MRGHYFHEESEDKIYEEVKNSAYEIIQRKQATYYGIAMAVKRICECIIRNEQSILPVSSMMHGIYGMEDVVISMPAIVGKDGVEAVVPIELDEEELEQIKKSAKIIDGDNVSFGNAVMKYTSNGYGVESEEAEDGKKVDFTNATRLVNLADNSAFYLNGTCLIGRDRTCNICLPMQSVSGEHAEVYPAKDGWYVADLNSKNGTLLNGEEVFGAFPLYDGDIISIGDYSFLFRE